MSIRWRTRVNNSRPWQAFYTALFRCHCAPIAGALYGALTASRRMAGYTLNRGTRPDICMLSYPRSGSNWVCYCIEELTGRPTPGMQRLLPGRTDYVIGKGHLAGIEVFPRHFEKMLFLIRNYKECIVRHFPPAFRTPATFPLFLRGRHLHSPRWYLKNLQAYDRFSGPKELIYYEDMLSEPAKEVPRMMRLFDVPEERIRAFIDNLEDHQKRSVGIYHGHQDSRTGGDKAKLVYHANQLSPDQRAAMDDFFRHQAPDLFARYLRRYEDPPSPTES